MFAFSNQQHIWPLHLLQLNIQVVKLSYRSDSVPSLTRMVPWTAFHLFNAVCATEQRNICQSGRVAAGLGHVAPPAKDTRWKSPALPHDAAQIRRDQHLRHSTAGLMRNYSKPRSKSFVANSLAGSADATPPVVFSEPPTAVLQGGQRGQIWLHMCAHTVCSRIKLHAFACVWQCVS